MVDLFSAIHDAEIPRDHPIYSALLYSYCPAAAGWWRSGIAVQTPSYDVAWHVLTDYAKGGDLKSALENYGLARWLGQIKMYIEAVSEVRHRYPALQSPELLPTYDLVKLETKDRFGLQDSIREHFGGNWRNVFEYARIWAYILPEWTLQIFKRNGSDIRLSRRELFVRIPNTPSSIHFPAFVWSSRIEQPERSRIGFLSNRGMPDELRCILGMHSAPEDGQLWEASPFIYTLDPITGRVQSFEANPRSVRLLEIFRELIQMAQHDPYPPLAALSDPIKCKFCPFNKRCLDPNIGLSQYSIRTPDSMIIPMSGPP